MKKLEGNFFRIAYADFLKYVAQKFHGWNGIKDEAGRTLLQTLGDKYRKVYPEFFVDRVVDEIEVNQYEYDYFLITDCRFQNEITKLEMMFGNKVTTLHIERLDFTNNLTEEQKNHKSENDLKDWQFNYYIKSPSGLDKLEIEVDKFIKEMNLNG